MYRRFSQSKSLLVCISILLLYIYVRATTHSANVQRPTVAIAQYATDRQYLCNALINVVRLVKLGSKSEFVVLLPKPFLTARIGSPIYRLVEALKQHRAILHGLDLDIGTVQDVTYAHSFQKLELLKLEYDRVIYFDNDGLVLRNLDHLAQMNQTHDLWLPRAYYVTHTAQDSVQRLSSAFMIIKPSTKLYDTAQILVQERNDKEFDMEIINKLVMSPEIKTAVLPYRHHLLLTGLFRDHSSYLPDSMWNAQEEYDQAYYIHFSDAPIPKPWVDDRGASFARHGPKCPADEPECDDVRIWKEVYKSFRDEMRELCPTVKELDI